MAGMTLSELSKKMAGIDFAMLSTRAENGAIAGRPMSNNGDVEYDGDSFFFAYGNARTVADIERDPKVGLAYQGAKSLLGRPPLFVALEGVAELIRDKAEFEKHWNSDLDYWFEDGIETPNVVMIKVRAVRIHYWDGKDEGEISL